jgi:hypothetical protein
MLGATPAFRDAEKIAKGSGEADGEHADGSSEGYRVEGAGEVGGEGAHIAPRTILGV